jgi:hypothetical protein
MRLAFLLAFLALPVFAAPAPFPRKKESTNAGAWSEPVAGLRVRLIAPAKKCKVGEPILLTLEIQNAGATRLSVEDPRFLPVVTAPASHFHRGRHFPWAITCEPLAKPKRRGDLEKQIDPLNAWCLLPPGKTLRIQITITPRDSEDVEEAKQGARKAEERRENLTFVGDTRPGIYKLCASFSRPTKNSKPRKGEWVGGDLKSRPVTIEVVD